jgi:GNAT superfamily N-acetyltransferase
MNVQVNQLEHRDLADADRIFRLAFGTFLGLPEPHTFGGDADYVSTRWQAAPTAAFGAYVDGELVGSNFLAKWGSFGFFGPLTVRPDLWDQGIARALLAQTLPLFAAAGVRHSALFTFPHSPRHVAIYQKFGYWPQQLTVLMSKAVAARANAPAWTVFGDLPPDERARQLAAIRALTDTVYP